MSRRNQLLDRLEELVAEERARKRERITVRQADLERKVAAYLAAHPTASSNAVVAAVAARRRDVLRAIHDVRQAAGWFPFDGNQRDEAGGAK